MAHVKTRQTDTIIEHVGHVCHLRRVEVFQARDRLEILHRRKPTMGTLRACVAEGRVKCRILHIAAISGPTWHVIARVQVVGRARAIRSHVVIVERQCRIVWRVLRIGLSGQITAQVARVAGADVDVGVSLVNMARVVGRAHATHEIVAGFEHIGRVGYRGCTPPAIDIDGGQDRTGIEHLLHVGHIGRVETAQVKARHLRTITEHAIHVGHIGRVETAHVDAREFFAGIEHMTHVSHPGCVEMTHINASQDFALLEHGRHV